MALEEVVHLFLAQLIVYKIICCKSEMLQVNLEQLNISMWVVLSVACDCVGISIPVGRHFSSLCFVCTSP